MPLAMVFLFIAFLGLVLALLGHAARANSPAPSMVVNNVSPIGWFVCVVFLIMAWAAFASFNP